jgi:class 3 adenylate cyclase
MLKNKVESVAQIGRMRGMIRLENRHKFSSPREVVWPCLSKTDWLNRALGLPSVDYQTAPRPEGGSWMTAEAKVPWGRLRWRELPFEWVEPRFYSVRRIFASGPFIEARMGIDFHGEPDGGTSVISFSELQPRNVFGKWLAGGILGKKLSSQMAAILEHAAQFLRGHAKLPFPRLPLQPPFEGALRAALEKLEHAGQPRALITRLEMLLRETPDVEISHMRPLAIARAWNEDSWSVLSLFLHATRCGLLDFSWEVLCPNCRSSRAAPANSLTALKKTSHCDVCQIEFDGEFDKSVELKFAVNTSIRPRDDRTFCLAGPGGKPHVVCQMWLEPGEERIWPLPDARGGLRLQSPQVGKMFAFTSDALKSARNISVSCAVSEFSVSYNVDGVAPDHSRVVNPNAFPVLLSWQQIGWSEDILTAARATNWQQFRDLFASEVISPTEQVTIGSQVILFTDLRGSTALYRDLGDAGAYALVRNHFATLTQAVQDNHGAVVKTIGDAVMASFSRLDEALTAVEESFRRLPSANPQLDPPLILKSSLHAGPCLAVNANDKLDFFGSTINLAARMVECCEGGDLTVSDEVFQRPETAEFVRRGYKAVPVEIQYRGFEAPRRVWRIAMGI